MTKPYEVEIMHMNMVPNTVVARIHGTSLTSVIVDFAESEGAREWYPVDKKGDYLEFWIEFPIQNAHELVEVLREKLYQAWLETQ